MIPYCSLDKYCHAYVQFREPYYADYQANWVKCEEYCNADSRCMAWTRVYHKQTKTDYCYLFDHVGGFEKGGAFSGKKYCPGNG